MKFLSSVIVLSLALMASASPFLGPLADTVLGTAANALNTVTGAASGLIGGALNAVGDVAKGAANLEFAKGRVLQGAVNGVAGLGSSVLGTGALSGPNPVSPNPGYGPVSGPSFGPVSGPGFGPGSTNFNSNSRGFDNSASANTHQFDARQTSFQGGPGGISGTTTSTSGQASSARTRSMGYDDSTRYQAGYGY
ncbi:uncharacterized protein LOC107363940 [Tetranychus urticae]|uniref:Uncharacterized protein n=1 Tax=Tetranychus urticae TaxID=32264 RepID=T1KGW5_TETUR|nr:uncharacterized protein LOC107363940 [Tetranychus urticae]